jgi:hypothetical protein
MTEILTAVTALFTGLFDIVVAILLPDAMTPLATLIWFGLLSAGVVWTVGFIRNLARGTS